jgi:hypothetical protein
MPASLVAKRYIADGGPLSEDEKKNVHEVNVKIDELEKEYGALIADDVIRGSSLEKKALTEEESGVLENKKFIILNDLTKLRETLNQYENTYESIYDNSAEAKARIRTLTWWSTQLSFVSPTLNKDYLPLFGEGDFQSKMERYDSIHQEEDTFLMEAAKIFTYFCSVYFASKGNIPEAEFKNIYKLYWGMSEYKVYDDEKEALEKEKALLEEKEAEAALVVPFPEPTSPK